MKKFIPIGFLTAVFAIAMFSCNGDEEKDVAVASVTVSAPDGVATATAGGAALALTAAVLPDDATDKSLTWTSATTAVATVGEKTGVVTPVSAGMSVITATAKNGKAGTLTVTVLPAYVAVASVTITDKKAAMLEGEKYTFKAGVKPDDATDKTIAWTSSNTAAATVNAATGEVTAVAAGTTTITAAAGDKSDACELTVQAETVEVDEIVMTETEPVTIDEFGTVTLAVTFTPPDATDQTLTWTSDNPDVATVENGVVTAVGEGTCTITAETANGKTATVTITIVEAAPESIAIAAEPLRKTYDENDEFDPEGLEIRGNYAAGKTKIIAGNHAGVTFDYDFSTAGADKTVRVKYKERTADIIGITVVEPEPVKMEIAAQSVNKNYGIGEPFNSAEKDYAFTVTFPNGSTKTITNRDVECDNAFSATAGSNKTVTVTYRGQSVNITGITVQTLRDRLIAVPSGGTATIYVYADEILTAPGNDNMTITLIGGLDGEGKSRERIISKSSGSSSLFGARGDLTIGENITLNGAGISNSNPVVSVMNNGKFTMKEGSKITGGNGSGAGSTNYPGGGVSVLGGGVFMMEGGEISGNKTTSTGSGAGVYINGGGTFTMSGGRITGNETANGGGGVYAGATAVFNMSGGEISNNTARLGDDVYLTSNVNSTAMFNLSGNAKIGNLLTTAITLTGAFTGSVESLDLYGAKSNWVSVPAYRFICHEGEACLMPTPLEVNRWLYDHFVPVPVIVAGEGVTLTKAMISGFTLGDFVASNGTRTPCSLSSTPSEAGYMFVYYCSIRLYGTEPDDDDVSKLGMLWFVSPLRWD